MIAVAGAAIMTVFCCRSYGLGRKHGREWERMLQRHAHKRIIEAAEHAMIRSGVTAAEETDDHPT